MEPNHVKFIISNVHPAILTLSDIRMEQDDNAG